MELESLSVPAINRFASLYLKQEAPVTDFFIIICLLARFMKKGRLTCRHVLTKEGLLPHALRRI